MDQALANRPYEVAGAKKHQRRLQPHRPLQGFKATASSCDDSQTAHATHSTPSPPHSRQDHETPTSPQTPDNKLHHRHAKIFKSPLRQTPPIVDQHSASYDSERTIPHVPLPSATSPLTLFPRWRPHPNLGRIRAELRPLLDIREAGRRRGGGRLGASFLLVAPRSRLASASPRTPRRHLAAFARGPAIRYGTCSLGPTGC